MDHSPLIQVKTILLTIAISGPALVCVLKIIELGGRYFYVYVWGFMLMFSIVMLTIAPVLIMPLFNKYTPLEVRSEPGCDRCGDFGKLVMKGQPFIQGIWGVNRLVLTATYGLKI